MQEAQIAGMADELKKIKSAGLGSNLWEGASRFFKGGLKGVGRLATGKGRSSIWKQTKNLPSRLRSGWQQGGWRGLGQAAATSTPVRMAGVAAVPFMAGRMSKRDNRR